MIEVRNKSANAVRGALTVALVLCPLHEHAEDLYEALQQIENWKFPKSGKRWPNGKEMSYSAAFGSNGERDFMREIARKALLKARGEG
jgi:hypothetical protein